MDEEQVKDTSNMGDDLPELASMGQKKANELKRSLIPRRKKSEIIQEYDEEYENAELPMMIGESKRQTYVVLEENAIGGDKTERDKKKNKKGLKKILSFLGVIVCMVVAVYSATRISLWNGENDESQSQLEEIQNMVVERIVEPVLDENPISVGTLETPIEPVEEKRIDYSKLSLVDVDFSKLKQVNDETKAYIKIKGLDVSAPVVQTSDNKYYLSHSYDKKYNSAGWIFGDYRNDWDNLKQNTIIYGHNRRNYIMFGSLKKILDQSWYGNKDNHVIYISTENSNMLFQIFSAYTIPTETYYLTNEFDTDEEYQNYLDTVLARSQVQFDVTPMTEDKILTLSTCHTSTTKMVVHAKLIKIQEK